MLVASGAANHSGNSVTTLTCSIVPHIIDRHQLVAPALHGRPRGDALEAEQPLAVIGPAAGEDERTRQDRSEEHTSELQSLRHLVCRLLLEKKKKIHMSANVCLDTT